MDINFPFPFKPYDIQNKFMKELYLTLENKKLGIFESPTGTGKSLSICCSALQWLRDRNRKQLEDLENEVAKLKAEISRNTGSNDWLQEEYEKIQKNQTLVALQLKLDKIKKQKEHYDQMKVRVSKQKSTLANKNTEFYFQKKRKNESLENEKENMTQETEIEGDKDLILEELDDNDGEDDKDDPEEVIDEDENDLLKIYISSRTHSQLSQFIGEIKRTVFKDDTRVVTLASRQHYCINSEVAKLKNVNLINERCLDMQKSKTKSTSVGEEGKVLKKTKTRSSCTACPYYNQSNIVKLKERLLVDIMDMEDLVKCGKELKACPYYASRMALDDAEVVLVSHAGVASAGARWALRLHRHVLVLDEAHALGAALESAHSAPVRRALLAGLRACLHFYIDKYRARLASRTLLSLNQIDFVVGKLLGMIKPKTKDKKQDDTTIFTLEDFVIKAEIDHMNLRPLVEFCRKSRLAPKLHGFSMRYSQQALEDEMKKGTVTKKTSFEMFMNNISKKKLDKVEKVQSEVNRASPVNSPTETSAGSGLYAVLDFLERLCDRSEHGRVLAQCHEHSGQLKYLLLNPAEHFSEVVKQCRSVIVAGGTMEPIAEFEALLTHNSARTDLTVLRCEHVVPPDNVLGLCLSRGPTNVTLNYSYENRMSNALLSETGRILRNVCRAVAGGVVCFLPAYAYERAVYQHLRDTKLLDHISKKKAVFREPKSASDVDQVLTKYAAAVKNKSGEQTGALMLSVVGGKLSEGLNFSDDLGRCVVVVGLPYPNVKSAELQEKMSYLNKSCGAGAGNLYYENLCMKAVNQCIGRAVRHAQDYACVLLVDERYSRPQTVAALPAFIQKSLITNCNFGMSIANIAKFFNKHKEKKT